MLPDDEIDKLIKPFVDRQRQLEIDVVRVIARRVKQIKHLTPSDVHKLQQLYEYGSDVKRINRMIARTAKIQEKDVKKMIKEVAVNTYKGAKPFYDYRHKSQIPYEKNDKLMRTTEAIAEQTGNTFKNMSNSKAIGFDIRDAKKPLSKKFQSVPEAYQSIIDEAVQSVVTGVSNFDTTMRKTMKQLNASGLKRAYWDSGYNRRLDSTVRMNILGGIRQINNAIQLQIAEDIGADGIEISAHEYPAPDHEPIQGHAFTLDNYKKLQSEVDFEDYKGVKFSAIKRPIGEWNCRHFIQYVILGAYVPMWSPQELENLKKANAKGYTDKYGKHYTMYQCTQMQRKYETAIRYAKEGYMMAKEAGNTELMEEYKTELGLLNNEYTAFSKACGLKKQKKRTSVQGFSY